MEHLVQILSVLGIGTLGAAIIAALATRKKVGADAQGKVVATAGELVDDLRADVVAAREERLRERQDRIVAENRQRRWWERADRHAIWDREMIRLCEENEVPVPPMPPLFPPAGE